MTFADSNDRLTIAFDASASFDPDGDALTYRWTFGDGATGRAAKPRYAYTRRGLHFVTLTVIDADGAPTERTKRVRIAGPPQEFAVTARWYITANPSSSVANYPTMLPATMSYSTYISLNWSLLIRTIRRGSRGGANTTKPFLRDGRTVSGGRACALFEGNRAPTRCPQPRPRDPDVRPWHRGVLPGSRAT